MSRFVDDFGSIFLQELGLSPEEITQEDLDLIFQYCLKNNPHKMPPSLQGHAIVDFVDEVLIGKAAKVVFTAKIEELLINSNK